MKRQRFTAEFKARVALEAIKGQKTLPEISAQYKVHSSQITKWKKQALERMADIFSGKAERESEGQEKDLNTLYQQIGKLQVENDFLKQAVYRS